MTLSIPKHLTDLLLNVSKSPMTRVLDVAARLAPKARTAVETKPKSSEIAPGFTLALASDVSRDWRPMRKSK